MKTMLNSDCIVIMRFLGRTQDSYNLRNVLQSICHQLLWCLNRSDTVPIDFGELHKFFITLLESVPKSKTLVLLLDSVHNLLPDYDAHALRWLPKQLKQNVKMLVSCQSHTHGMVTKMRTEIIQNHNNFIDLPPLSSDQAMSLILQWLQKESMTITNDQADVMKQIFTKCTLPLYLQMVFSEMKHWSSFQQVDAQILGRNCETYLDLFFTNLECQHGQVVVTHALAYLTASKTGLSDMEMEDLLSLDEAVLSYVFQNFSPAVRRCPPYVWSRLRDDIERFLETKAADNHTIQFWNHSFFTQYIQDRYLSNKRFQTTIHQLIADYYLGTWHGKPMAFVDLFGRTFKADRLVISQPLTYTNSLGEIEYNRRKYDQVPRHLFLANRLEELNGKVLFNYDWLYNKIKVLSLQHILADLSLNPSAEAALLEESLRSAQAVLERNINNMPTELAGRLLPYYHIYPNIQKLIQQCDTAGLSHCALVPIFSYQQVPGSPLQHTLKYTQKIDSIHLLGDGCTLVTKSDSSQMVRLFDVRSGTTKADLITSYGRLMVSPDDKYLVIVDNEIEKSIKIHNISDGAFEGQLIPLKADNIKDSRKYNLGAISITEKYIAVLVHTDTSYLCIGELSTTKLCSVIPIEGKAHLILIAKNNRYILCGNGYNVVAYDLETCDQICLTQLEYKATSLVMTTNCTKVFYFSDKSSIVTICHNTTEGYTQMMSKIQLARQFSGDHIKRLKLSHDQNLLMVLGETNIVVLNALTDKLVLLIRKPEHMLKEFQLPRHVEPTPITFTDAIFSMDDSSLLVSLFRNIQVWSLQTSNLLQHPITTSVGIVTNILLSPLQNQILSLQQEAECVQVWNLSNSSLELTSTEKVNAPIDSIVITADNSLCFTKGDNCTEVAVIDMTSGTLANFLSHPSVVEELVPTNDGSFLLTTVKPEGDELYHKIWSLKERRIIEQFGKTKGLSIALRKSRKLIHINQSAVTYRAPYRINIYSFEESFDKTVYDFLINNIIGEPVITSEDTYMVFLTADECQETAAVYSNPAICMLYLQGRYMHNVIGKQDLGTFLDTRNLVSIVPIPESRTEIIATYLQQPQEEYNISESYGYATVNLATGTLLKYHDNFMAQGTDLRTLYLNNTGSQCISSQTGFVFDMKSGSRVGKVNNARSPISLLYNGATVVYFKGCYLIAERVSDNTVIATCDVHVDICYICAGNDGRTVMVGCVDGTLLSYAVIDEEQVTSTEVLKSLPTRATQGSSDKGRPLTARTWDSIDSERQETPVSRLSSATSNLQTDKEILRKIRPAYRPYTTAKSMTNYSLPMSTSYTRSKTCTIM